MKHTTKMRTVCDAIAEIRKLRNKVRKYQSALTKVTKSRDYWRDVALKSGAKRI